MFTGRWYCILTVSMSKTYVQSSFTSPQRLHFIILIYFIRRTQLQSYHPFFKLFLLPHSESMWAHLRHHRHFEKVIPPHEAIAMTKITSTSNPAESPWICGFVLEGDHLQSTGPQPTANSSWTTHQICKILDCLSTEIVILRQLFKSLVWKMNRPLSGPKTFKIWRTIVENQASQTLQRLFLSFQLPA